MSKYTFIGSISSGKSVFWNPDDGLAVEKDHGQLVEPTQLEQFRQLTQNG